MGKQEPASVRIVRIDPNASADMFYNQLANRKSQARSLRSFIEFFKTIEHLRLLFRRNAATGIGHREKSRIVRLLLQRQRYAALRGKLRSVY